MKSVMIDLLQQNEVLVKKSVLSLIVAIVVWQFVSWLMQPSTMPIKQVRIGGELNYVTAEDISTSLSALVDTGYFAMNSSEIVKHATALPWVNKATIRRVWPDTIVLTLVEQKPAAIWNKTALLNTQGEVFKPVFDNSLETLPSLSGVETSSQAILEEYRKVNNAIKSTGIQVSKLSLAEHGSWSAVMSNGIKVSVGHQSPEQAIGKSLRLLASLEGSLIDQLAKVDLRYPNGVSVQWKDGYKFADRVEQIAALKLKKDQPVKG